MSKNRQFEGDDLRKADPKFQEDRFSMYLKAVDELDKFARKHYGKSVIHLAVRWILDKGADVALWGARRPDQLNVVGDMSGWHLDESALKAIDHILEENITNPVGPEFMAPPKA